MISKIYLSLLDRWLRGAIEQCERQKGFTEESSCYSNIQLLGSTMSNAKKEGGVISILDVCKAFDTLPDSVIAKCLERKGVPHQVAAMIDEMYRDCFTVVRARNGNIEIGLKMGVKQGDAISPLVSNLAIEPLLERLQTTSGIQVQGYNLSALAFADGVTCLAKTANEGCKQLQMVSDYLDQLDMCLSINECAAFEYVPFGKT